MWGTVLVLGLMAVPDPFRLGVVLLLLSRPRPLPNLLAYWLGALATGAFAALGLLVLVRSFAPMVTERVASVVASSAVHHIQTVGGVLALLAAALIAVGFSVRQRTLLPIVGAGPPTVLLQPRTPTGLSRLKDRVQDALGGGSLWVAFGAGLGSGPPPIECLVAFTAISASGAAVGTQVSAVAAYFVVMLAIVEVPLIGYLARPARTELIMVQLSDWMRIHRRRIFAIIIGVAGVALMTGGIGAT